MSSIALFLFSVALLAFQSVYCREYPLHINTTCTAHDLAPSHLTFGRPAPVGDGDWKEIVCYDRNALDIKSIIDVVRRAKYFSSTSPRNLSFAQMAPLITQVLLQTAGNITITGTDLGTLPKLNSLFLAHKPNSDKKLAYLNIELNAVENLTTIGLDGFFLNDNTVQAISGVKDRLHSFYLQNCQPNDEVLKLPEKLTKINILIIVCNDTKSSPVRKFDRLSKKLQHLSFKYCNIGNISSTMFREMKNLTHLSLDSNFVSIVEETAFDDLVNLEYLSLSGNEITSFPENAFNKTVKLCRVVLREGLFRDDAALVNHPYPEKNFAHCRS